MSDNNSQRAGEKKRCCRRDFVEEEERGQVDQNGERRLHEISGLLKVIQRCVQFLKGAPHVIWPQTGVQPKLSGTGDGLE